MPSPDKLALQLAAESIRAEESIRDHGGQMTADELYEAVRRATGSISQAEAAFMARRKAELKSGETPRE